tara:strand:- start:130 stop:363 length:234 start_codon:yes stop_codon:yes gene_type:complete
MNKVLFQKGLKRMVVFLLCCFFGPVFVYQAFKNKEHPLFYPVLIIGLSLLSVAIYYGFLGVKTILNALLGEQKKRNL